MVAEVGWAATGGSIDSNGVFEAGRDGGVFSATATAAGNEAVAEVRIGATEDVSEVVETSGPRTIRWSGNVPPQKWMQFYTRVLSKYATSPDLKIEVTFQIKVDSDQADNKSAETKNALRELGLTEDVRQ
jgi:hypothetical protein